MKLVLSGPKDSITLVTTESLKYVIIPAHLVLGVTRQSKRGIAAILDSLFRGLVPHFDRIAVGVAL
jgi:hypothetical protein